MWRLRDLGGKVILINLWATWCGECAEELPKLQKLYEQTNGRSDIQILTFDLDEDLGMVAPYLKDRGYTFPVLPAYALVNNLLDGYGIPQNWVVDPKGNWQWMQTGYGAEDNWAQVMIQKLESAKTSNCAVTSDSSAARAFGGGEANLKMYQDSVGPSFGWGR